MTKYPFMPFYVADFQVDTQHLNWKEKAAYRAILDAYWMQGSGPKNDDKRLARIIGMTPEEWSEVRENVLEFFTVEDGNLVQKRIEIEISKAKQITETAKEKASKRWNKGENQQKPCTGNAPAMPQHEPSMSPAMPSTSTSTEFPVENFKEEFDGAGKNPARETAIETNPNEWQTPPDGEEPPEFTATPEPKPKPPIQSHDLSIPRGHCERFTNGDLDEVCQRFGGRSQEALDIISLKLEAGDYERFKRPWAQVKTWLAKEATAMAWLDKATGKGATAGPTAKPADTRNLNEPPVPEDERVDLGAFSPEDFLRRADDDFEPRAEGA